MRTESVYGRVLEVVLQPEAEETGAIVATPGIAVSRVCGGTHSHAP